MKQVKNACHHDDHLEYLVLFLGAKYSMYVENLQCHSKDIIFRGNFFPSADEGFVFSKDDFILQPFEEIVKLNFQMYFISCDTAIKTGVQNDFSAIAIAGAYDGRLYLIEMIKTKLTYRKLKETLEAVYIHYYEKKKDVILLIEDASSGSSLFDEFAEVGMSYSKDKTLIPSMRRIKPRNVKDDKEKRAEFATIHMRDKFVVPNDTDWYSDYITEMLNFPHVKHDDQVDATTQLINFALKQERIYLFTNNNE